MILKVIFSIHITLLLRYLATGFAFNNGLFVGKKLGCSPHSSNLTCHCAIREKAISDMTFVPNQVQGFSFYGSYVVSLVAKVEVKNSYFF